MRKLEQYVTAGEATMTIQFGACSLHAV